MPALHHGYSSDDEEKVDILSLLENAGVEFIVYKIIHMLELRDICSVLQVCSNWNSYDNDHLWKKELNIKQFSETKPRSEQRNEECPKENIKLLWRLQQCWRRGDRSQVSVELDSSVLSITGHGLQLLCGLNSGDLVQADLGSGLQVKRKEIHEKGVKVVRVDAETGVIWTGSYDGRVRVWDRSWCQVSEISIGVAVTDLAFIRDSVFISGDETSIVSYTGASRAGGDLALAWSVSVAGGEMMNCLTVWREKLVTGSDAGLLEIRNINNGEVEQSFEGHDRGCGISGLDSNHLGLWSCSFDCKIALWSESGVCLCLLIGHTQPVRCLAVDAVKLVSGDYRGFVMVWDMEDIQREIWSFQSKQAKKKSSVINNNKTGIYRMRGRQVIQTGSDTCEVLQHSSILEHHGNVTQVILLGQDVLVSASRDRTCNIHQFHKSLKTKKYERKSYL